MSPTDVDDLGGRTGRSSPRAVVQMGHAIVRMSFEVVDLQGAQLRGRRRFRQMSGSRLSVISRDSCYFVSNYED